MLVLAHTLPTLKFRLTAWWKMRDNDNIFSPGDSHPSCVSPLRTINCPRWFKRILADFFKYHTSSIVHRPLFVYSHTIREHAIHRLRSSNNSNSQSLTTFFRPFNFVKNMKNMKNCKSVRIRYVQRLQIHEISL